MNVSVYAVNFTLDGVNKSLVINSILNNQQMTDTAMKNELSVIYKQPKSKFLNINYSYTGAVNHG